MTSFFSHRKTQKAVSGFLAIWLSGLFFLLCCGTMQTPANAEICPLAKAGNHCDKMKTETNSPTISDESGFKVNCCAFLPALFDKARNIEKTQQTAQVPTKLKIDLPQIFFVQNDFQLTEIYQPPISNQNKIFIKNCIFRI